MSDDKKRRGVLAQGIYGLVIGVACALAIPLALPLSVIAIVPATLALGFGAAHVRDAILWERSSEQH